jgi:hypothetical protein
MVISTPSTISQTSRPSRQTHRRANIEDEAAGPVVGRQEHVSLYRVHVHTLGPARAGENSKIQHSKPVLLSGQVRSVGGY